MWNKLGTALGGAVVLFLTVNASCPSDPCRFMICNPGYHCENGLCVPNTPPVDPCQGVTCETGYHCENGKCVQNPPPEDPCQGVTCNQGYHCEKGVCVKDPIIDPCEGVVCDKDYHCEKGNCIPDNPPPPTNPCPKELAPGAVVYMNNKAYGQGWDSTVRVKGDPEFCRLINSTNGNDCHLEGWPKRAECEYYLLGNNCPVWEYESNGVIYPCHDDQSAIASCDHFGNPVYRDDPKTPTTGDTLETLRGFEGEPKVCGLHRDSFGPYQGFFMVAHGIGNVRACKPDRKPETCGPWKAFNH